MDRITKTIASSMAERMVNDTIGKKISELKYKIGEKGDLVVKENIPSEVFAVMAKWPDYIKKDNHIRVKHDSIQAKYSVECNNHFPDNGAYRRWFEVDRKTLDWFLKKGDELDLLNSEKRKMLLQIEETLLSLRTSKRIAKEFPNAVPYLPTEEAENKIALPIQELSNLLNKYK